MVDFPSNKEFLDRLGRLSHDLRSIVEGTLHDKKEIQTNKSFEEDPFQKDEEGNNRFGMYLWYGEYQGKNLLEEFDNLEDISEFIESLEPNHQTFSTREINTGTPITPHYKPRIHVFPDANIVINKETRKIQEQLEKDPTIDYHLIKIVEIEQTTGGIKKRFPKELPEDLFRGQDSLEDICTMIYSNQREDINTLYDVIVDYFSKEFEERSSFIEENSRLSKEKLARNYAEIKGKLGDRDYIEMTEKIVNKYRKGNFFNPVADQVLTATCFGFNLLNRNHKSVILSNDGDLAVMQELFYDEIMPRYTAKTIISGMEVDEQKEFLKNSSYEALVEAAREHITWARNDSSVENTTVGVVYVQRKDKFYTQEVASPLREFFNNVGEYREGKSRMIKEIAISGKTPEEIVKSFYNK